MPQYMLVLHDVPADYAHLGMQELSGLVQRYVDWMEGLKSNGHYVASFKLGSEGGRMLTPEGTSPVPTDGPYAEAKDVIGGAFVIEAKDIAEAEKIARDSPHLRGRNRIEVRAIDEDSCDAIIKEARRERDLVWA